MSRPPSLEPRWLIGLLSQWARRSLHSEIHTVGWYNTNLMLSDGIPSRVTSYDPTGYGDADFRDVNQAVAELRVMRRLAVLRYFKPWTAALIDQDMKRDTDTWCYHLRQALDELRVVLDRKNLEAYSA